MAMTAAAVGRLSPRIGRSRALSRPWSGFHPVVAVAVGQMAGRRQQLVEHADGGGCLVGGHLDRPRRPPQRLDEEPAGRGRVPPPRDHHVDDLAELVDRPVQIASASGDLHVRLIGKPPVTGSMPARPGRLHEQRAEPLHPPVDGHVVDLDAALGE